MATLNIGWCNYQWLLVFIQLSLSNVLFIFNLYFTISLTFPGDISFTSTLFWRWARLLLWISEYIYRISILKEYVGAPHSCKTTGWIVFKRILDIHADWISHLVYDRCTIRNQILAHSHRKIWCWLLFSTSFFWLLEILYCWAYLKWVMRYLIIRYWETYFLGTLSMET